MAEQQTDDKKVKKVSRIKVQKKIWFKVLAPKIFANKEIGETYLPSADKAIGKTLKVNLKDLTGNMKDQNTNILLQINKVVGSQLNTAVMGYEMTASGVRRAVRKNIDRLDDFFHFKTKTGKNVIIKTLMVTVTHTQRSKHSMLRKILRESLQEEVSKSDLNTLISNLAFQKIQYPLRKKLNKIYPLREMAIRVFRIVEPGLAQEEIIIEDNTVPEQKEEELPKKAVVEEVEESS